MFKVSQDSLQVAVLEAGLSQADLAAKTLINPARISKLLKNGGYCRNTTILKLAAALNVPPTELIFIKGKV